MSRRRRIWVTRAEPGASATARRLEALGHDVLVAPLLEVRPVQATPDLEGISALAFTSANGVSAFARLISRRDLPVFAVGGATAAAARKAGFAAVVSADGDVHDLVRRIAAECVLPGGTAILHPCAAEPAGDLAGDLIRHGVPCRRLVVYETIMRPVPEALRSDLVRIDDVLVHSPRAGRALRNVLGGLGPLRLRVIGISAAALAPLEDLPLAGRLCAARPDEASMFALLDG